MMSIKDISTIMKFPILITELQFLAFLAVPSSLFIDLAGSRTYRFSLRCRDALDLVVPALVERLRLRRDQEDTLLGDGDVECALGTSDISNSLSETSRVYEYDQAKQIKASPKETL